MPEKAKRHLAELDLTGRSFLTIHDFEPAEIVTLLDLAAELKDAQKRRMPHKFLEGRAVAMVFMKTSTRTRMSFEVGIEQLGAQPIFLNANDIQLRVGETIKDTANVMSRYVRLHHDPHVRAAGRGGPRPLRPDPDHQRAHRQPSPVPGHGRRDDDPRARRPPAGRPSWSTSATATTWPTRWPRSAPRPACTWSSARRTDYKPDAGSSRGRRRTRRRPARPIELTSDVAAVEGADVIYTDTFTSMGQEAEHDVRLAAMRDYQVNTALLGEGRPAGQGHALPAGALGRGDHRRGAVLAATPWSSTRRRTACTRRRRSWRRSSPDPGAASRSPARRGSSGRTRGRGGGHHGRRPAPRHVLRSSWGTT